MELFDKLGDTIISVSKDATQRAKDLSELARLRMEIRAKQDYLNKLYLEIGKIYYDAHKDDEEKEFKEQMLLIKDALEVLDELKQQLGQIKGTVKCTACGQDMPIEADFCSKCGTKLVKPKKEEEEDLEDIFEDEADAESADAAADDMEDPEQSAAEGEADTAVTQDADVQTAADTVADISYKSVTEDTSVDTE
ncbi:MAG: zinc ribbon domain-containing protein [Eubacterium sp.]|nr:zinc ribbon domain-containing protein [Eubacterium sp.]